MEGHHLEISSTGEGAAGFLLNSLVKNFMR
jgi:hypothetical protein